MSSYDKITNVKDLERIIIAKKVINNFSTMTTKMYAEAINKLLTDITYKIDHYIDDEEYKVYQDIQNLTTLKFQVIGLWAHNLETQPNRMAILDLIDMMQKDLYNIVDEYNG